jgi:predicted MFS family arabinose efflux permease
VVAVFSLLLVPVVLLVLRDRPSDVGQVPYGAPASYVDPPIVRDGPGAATVAVTTLREVSRRWTFWALFLTFWICGWSTNGLIGTHFIPAAHDHGMPETTAAGLLALIGIFDIIGTIASGWLTDKVDSRYLLFGYYFLRGLSLLVVPVLLGPHVQPSLFLFIVFYGLDWVATVPPTVALCREHFGLEKSGVVFGWVFAAHMVGAGVAASYAGFIRQGTGDYFLAWMTAGGLCLLAAVMCLSIPNLRRTSGNALEDVGQETPQI